MTSPSKTTSPQPLSDDIRRRMQKQAQRDTEPELALRRVLHAKGHRYRVHYKLHGLRQRIDIAFVSKKVAVFVDGCFWHNCPEHGTFPKNNAEWWRNKLRENQERDRHTTQLLNRLGWTVMRIWEHEPPEAAAQSISSVLRRESQARCPL